MSTGQVRSSGYATGGTRWEPLLLSRQAGILPTYVLYNTVIKLPSLTCERRPRPSELQDAPFVQEEPEDAGT